MPLKDTDPCSEANAAKNLRRIIKFLSALEIRMNADAKRKQWMLNAINQQSKTITDLQSQLQTAQQAAAPDSDEQAIDQQIDALIAANAPADATGGQPAQPIPIQ